MLAGCPRSPDSTPVSSPETAATSGQYHNELLTYAIDNLNRLEEFESSDALRQMLERLNARDAAKTGPSGPTDTLLAAWPEPEMLRQIVDRLNQWIRVQPPPADWRLDPMLSSLPKPLAELPQRKDLDRMEFSRFDGYFLQEAVWLRDVGKWARGEALDDLERARSLFDWTVRNIQIEADAPGRIPQFPWETLLLGRGTAVERAWVFILLARQSGIDAAVLGIEEGRGLGTSVPSEVGSRQSAVGSKAEIQNPKSQIPNLKSEISDLKSQISNPTPRPSSPVPRPSSPAPRPWCVAVLIEGGAYLFEPLLGLPIPAPDGVTRAEDGQLAIRPATLAQVVADEKLLRRLDADENHAYGVKAADLKHVVAMLEASPGYLAKRMALLESRLAGPQKMVLTAPAAAQAERWRAVAHVGRVQLWLRPWETIEQRSHLDREHVRARLAVMLPFYALPSAPLRRGRVLYLKGKLIGEDGATAYYQMARPSNQELLASSAHPVEKLVYHRGKQNATYWLGLIAYQRANYPAAVDYFARRTLELAPDGPWSGGARYNLARTFEAAGDPQRAILQYDSNADSPGYLGDLLRAKWLKDNGRRAGGR